MKKLIIILFAIFLLASPVFAVDTSLQIKKADAGPTRLIKLAGDTAVYYQAANGRRYVFPNDKIYFSWFADFKNVVSVSAAEFGLIQIGGNVKYKPNSRLIKITSDPKVYWVNELGVLNYVPSETEAVVLFGADWAKKVDDLDVSYFAGYTIGEALGGATLPAVHSLWALDDNENIFLPENNGADNGNNSNNNTTNTTTPAVVDAAEQPSNIKLTVWVENSNVQFKWLSTGGNAKYGIALIKSANANPVYNVDETVKVPDFTAEQYVWSNIANGAYYFQACRVNSDGSCGTTSNISSQIIGSGSETPSIVLTGYAENGVVKLSWTNSWVSPNYGYYLLRGYDPDPRLKYNLGLWVDKTATSYDWQGLDFGIQHFRLCRYTGTTNDMCQYYSNDVTVEIK